MLANSPALPSPPGPPAQPGTSRYETREEIAVGGMGAVYRALDRQTGELRALKRLLTTEGPRAAVQRAAFEREYQVLASLDHPRIIRVYDYGVDATGPYYVMELLEGDDLRALAPMPWREACRALRDLATSLSLLHARGLVYRDLSPGNVKIGPDSRAKLFDFGALADFGVSERIVGTAPMIAPEAYARNALDQRTDLYALGALGYWLVTGQHAFPAHNVRDLPRAWTQPPLAASELVAEVPRALSQLFAELLRADAMARPSSAADVIVRISGIANFTDEDARENAQLAESYLRNPCFIGRHDALAELDLGLEGANRGEGSAIGVAGVRGSGRTRLLDEAAMRARLRGATVVRVDASALGASQGVPHAIAQQLFLRVPASAREHAREYRPALRLLGPDIAERLPSEPERARPITRRADLREAVHGVRLWIVAVAKAHPLVVQVDNADQADDASLGFLADLASAASTASFALQFSTLPATGTTEALGLSALRSYAARVSLPELDAREMLSLMRTLFGDAPNCERFSEWMHAQTGGNPLYSVELTRQLAERDAIRFQGGTWHLPERRPHIGIPSGLDDVLHAKLDALDAAARTLGERGSLLRVRLDDDLCAALADGGPREAERQVDTLKRAGILVDQGGGALSFASSALRQILTRDLDESTRDRHHLHIGKTLERLSGDAERVLRIEAGYHFIEGGEEARGADLTASALRNCDAVRTLLANLYHAGAAAEAALGIYKRFRRSKYECMPLLGALAQAGYYEDLKFSQRHGDEALDVLEELSGIGWARRAMPWIGRLPALLLGVFGAVIAFMLVPRAERRYPFKEIFVQFFTTVTTLSGTATVCLDGARADRLADTLLPFSVLPRFTTPRGIFEYCEALRDVPREPTLRKLREAEALAARFDDPRKYPLLPFDSRRLLQGGLQFLLGARYMHLADSAKTLTSADLLDQTGLKLHAMIASQLRFLYHMYRGELSLAEPHRRQVELHAAHVGSAWQVEMWQASALSPVSLALGDSLAITRIRQQLSSLAKVVPSLAMYRRLLHGSELLISRSTPVESVQALAEELAQHAPRSFLGWTTSMAGLAHAYNLLGDPAAARAQCELALAELPAEDRCFTGLFLWLELEAARADASLGKRDLAMARLDERIAALLPSKHPLCLGLLHELRATISFEAGLLAEFEHSRREALAYFKPTRTPHLLVKCENLLALDRPDSVDALIALHGKSEDNDNHSVMETTTEDVA